MSANLDEMVTEQCYVAVLRTSIDFDAKPLMTGVITLMGSGNLNWFQLMKAGELNGKYVYTRRLVNKEKGPGPKSLRQALDFYQETIDAVVSQYEKKHGALNFNLPILELQTQPIMPATKFVEHAISLSLMGPDTLVQCKTTSAPPPPSVKPPPPAPSGASLSSSSGAAAGSSTQQGEASSAASLDGSSSTGVSNASSNGDSVLFALQQAGVDVETHAEVVEKVCDGREIADLLENEGTEEVMGEEAEFERMTEVSLLKIKTLPADEQQHPMIKDLEDTVRRQQAKIKELRADNLSLNQLTAMQDQNIREFQSNSAESIIPGILPAIKQALGSIKKEVTQGVDERMDSLLSAIKEQGQAPLATELSQLRSCLATTAGAVSETNLLVQSTMGAVILVDRNLKSVGLGSRDTNASPVDIPSMLTGIQAKMQQAPSVSTPPFLGSPATVQKIEAFKPSNVTAGPRFSSVAPSSEILSRKSSCPGTSSGQPPRKSVKWDVRAEGSSTPAPHAGAPASKFAPRSLEAELNASHDSPSSNPGLYSAMMHAKKVFTPMTKQQVEEKTKEQIEMKKQLLNRGRR